MNAYVADFVRIYKSAPSPASGRGFGRLFKAPNEVQLAGDNFIWFYLCYISFNSPKNSGQWKLGASNAMGDQLRK